MPANTTGEAARCCATRQYDPFGRRIEKVSPTGTTIYAYDGDNVVEELDGSGTSVARYTQGLGIDEPLAMVRGGASYYYDADGLGSITSLADASGQIAASYTYDSFGKLTASTGTVTNPFRYTGREYDSDAGLYFYRARYYDSDVGRFISEDPIQFEADFNFYRYVWGNPVVYTDPYGLYWVYCLNDGKLYHSDPYFPEEENHVAAGYAGKGPGLNNPKMQDVPYVGPLPEHYYNIGPQQTIVTGAGKRLYGAMRLTPIGGTPLPGNRGGFIIHADNGAKNHTASEGCPIFDRPTRDRIASSGDNELDVRDCE